MLALVVVRVWHGQGHTLAGCELWVGPQGQWTRHEEMPAGVGATMRQIEGVIARAGYDYPLTDLGLRARWRKTDPRADEGTYDLRISCP